MLAVGAGLAPNDWAGLVVHDMPVHIDMLAVALHLQLLEVGGEAGKMRGVRHDANGLGAKEIVVPDRQKTQQQR